MEREPIETERLRLVPIRADEAAAILAGDLSGIRAGEGWPHADTLDGLRVLPGWFATLDDVVIGDCGTHGEPAGGEVEIGYGLAEPYRGRGLGGELVAGLAGWLLRRDGIRRVVARVEPPNLPSRRALERAGFRLERDDGGHLLYVLEHVE